MSADSLDGRLAAIVATCPRPVAVVGDSELAGRLRTLAGPPPDEQPATVIDTTGTASGIITAFESVADLGTVVLAGPTAGVPLTLDLHDTVHVRGLTVLGVDMSSEG